mmetsp:Transcript_7945/g.12014  ORF Transcript_7945/g.12014 Transcript_7945/m.12014 type:complete len:356 (-) Transcript_7945:48-1115(-)|eukprot:CAMPEP_0201518702 /NCGR_PEP_ID=MMETSP0161_2-20130828/9470_1 /ASSEMBLY_ACC=CAM_ASM_000251 /TAXON_ID=180227 /ORGANISM="Neoparamoeba aestuarina, Strain SoJaBio B1-5/56/2" /LENGTH=355 /DNA_ID=CAMNT_0047916545 /DNA_START=63 /DNA_END=1130 /DNA_ORIENTATION=+
MALQSAISHQSDGIIYLNEEFSGDLHVECSPLPGSYGLITLSEAKNVHLLRAVFDQTYHDRGYPMLKDEGASCQFGSEVSLVRWGAGSNCAPGAPSAVDLAVACGNSLYYCSKQFDSYQLKRTEVGKHSAMIMDAAFPSSSRSSKMVSVGEDCRLRLWDLEKGGSSVHHLSSAGASVRWYEDGSQSILFVAEESGVVTMKDLRVGESGGGLRLRQSFRSEGRLQSMDWTDCFPTWLGGVANNTWHIWDLKMASAPVQTGPISTPRPVNSFRWGQNPRSPQQPIFFVSGFGHWQMWEVQQGRQLWEVQQQDDHQINRVSGAHWKAENPKVFTGNASLFAGGPSVLVGNYKQLEFVN